MAVRGLPTNNIPAVMAAAAGYKLCTVGRDESGNPTTVKVEGLIRPPLTQMTSTKACYKLGLVVKNSIAIEKTSRFIE